MHPPFETAPGLSDGRRFRHGFFGRRGGVSTGLYESLNTGEGSDDRPEAVAENRARVARALGAKWLLSCYQIHSAEVVTVTGPWAERPRADAMVTDRPGLGLCILSADCTPVLLADESAGIIGAAHAGWKGALTGILPATIAAMARLGARREAIIAAIGPAIRQASYEVGPDLRAAFLARDAASDDLFAPGRGDRLQFDLAGFCARQLAREGLARIDDIGHDTYVMEAAYFSNRRRILRGEADYGRNASAIVLV